MSIGTTTSHEFRIRTADTDAITIDASQRVGIGTSAPGQLLDVNGGALFAGDITNSAGKFYVVNTYGYFFGGSGNLTGWQGSNGTQIIQGFTGGTERLRIDSAGLVGIGTSSPGALTHLSNTSSSTGYNFFQITAGSESQVHTIKSTISTGRDLEVNSARTLKFTTGSNTGAFASEGHFQFSHGTNGDLVRITADGKVGIGTTAPSQTLGVAGGVGIGNQLSTGTTGSIKLTSSGGTNYIQSGQNTSNASAAPLVFTDYNAFNEWARIDSSGRLLVGTSSSSATVRAVFQDNSGSTGPGHVLLATSSSVPTSAEALGRLRFSAANHVESVQIEASRDGGTWTAGSSQPSKLTFSTTADGANSPTERLRITSAGLVGIGTSSPSTRLHLNSADASANYLRVENTGGYAFFGIDSSATAYAGAESNNAFGTCY
jgi:hypothetical protein